MMKSHNRLSVAGELGGWDGGSMQVTWITSICSHWAESLGGDLCSPERPKPGEPVAIMYKGRRGGSSGSRTENYNFLILVFLILPWTSANWRVSFSLKAQNPLETPFKHIWSSPVTITVHKTTRVSLGWGQAASDKCVCFSPCSPSPPPYHGGDGNRGDILGWEQHAHLHRM